MTSSDFSCFHLSSFMEFYLSFLLLLSSIDFYIFLCHLGKNGKSPAAKKKDKTKDKKDDRGRAGSKLSSNDIEVVSNSSSSAAAVSGYIVVEVRYVHVCAYIILVPTWYCVCIMHMHFSISRLFLVLADLVFILFGNSFLILHFFSFL